MKIRYPKTEYLNNTRIAKLITGNAGLYDTEMKIVVGRDKDKQIMIRARIYGGGELLPDRDLSPFDLAIMDTVYTLHMAGNKVMTPLMILKTMSGNCNQRPTAQKTERIVQSIQKLMQLRIEIDCTDEMQMRRVINKDEEMHLDDCLLAIDDDRNGNEIEYSLRHCPVLYQYAEKNRQIISVPVDLLNVKTISETETNILLRRYLIRRIEMIRCGKVANRISYEWRDSAGNVKGLLKDFGIDRNKYNSTWRNKKMEIHESATKILTAYRNYGYIADYKVIRDKQEILGFDIIPRGPEK